MIVYKDPDFSSFCADDVSYGFYGRAGGVSTGLYTSLNCAPGSSDDPAAVAENRRLVVQHLGFPGREISTLYQCHSATCHFITQPVQGGEARPKADALVTDKPDLPLGVLTADCGPVLFHALKENSAPVIGAAHAGWGGALGGILDQTVSTMVQAGAHPDTITACLGPCIGPASYEVSETFQKPFLDHNEDAAHFFKSTRKPGHLMFDLPGYIAFRLSLVGVKRVKIIEHDTYKEEESCFSFRRATHRSEPDYGRELSVIVINP